MSTFLSRQEVIPSCPGHFKKNIDLSPEPITTPGSGKCCQSDGLSRKPITKSSSWDTTITFWQRTNLSEFDALPPRSQNLWRVFWGTNHNPAQRDKKNVWLFQPNIFGWVGPGNCDGVFTKPITFGNPQPNIFGDQSRLGTPSQIYLATNHVWEPPVQIYLTTLALSEKLVGINNWELILI